LLKLQGTDAGQFYPTCNYELREGFLKHLLGTYIHSKLVNAVAMWASVKYLLIVSEIMDNINTQAHLLEKEGNEYLQQTITQQKATIESLKSDVNNLNKVIIDNEKRMVPKEYKNHYHLMLYYDTPYTLKLVRRSNDSWFKTFEGIKNSPDCIFYRRDLPISVTFGK
jgi:hypothetical protein